MTKVNFAFISELEGGPVLTGYVPDPDKSNSGVTIATGFDLGQRNEDDLVRLLPGQNDLIDKLVPYCGLKKQNAVARLNQLPLEITEEEAGCIDQAVKQRLLSQLQQRYNSVAIQNFADLHPAMQTVIASVAFQYGDLARRCPKFWTTALSTDTKAMINELKNFGDRYPTRRNREANYLQLHSRFAGAA